MTFWEVDILGVDVLGVDILGVDILGRTPRMYSHVYVELVSHLDHVCLPAGTSPQ